MAEPFARRELGYRWFREGLCTHNLWSAVAPHSCTLSSGTIALVLIRRRLSKKIVDVVETAAKPANDQPARIVI
jgi:hypothetical protein